MLGGQKQQIPETVIQSRQGEPRRERRRTWEGVDGGRGLPQEDGGRVGCGWWGARAAPGEAGQAWGVRVGRGHSRSLAIHWRLFQGPAWQG